VAGVAALAILLIAVGIASSGSSGISDRLERYASGRPEGGKPSTTGQGPISDLIAQSQALANLNKVVEGRDFGANLARELARADLRLKPSEYLFIMVGSTIGVPVAMFIFSFFLPALGSPLALLIGALIGFLLPRFWLNRRKGGRLNAFNKQLPDTITLIANALRAGSSFLQAIELVVRESRPPISTEFGRVIREVNLGLPFDQALENMVRRVRSDDLELMATAISIQHQVGGNLAEILDSISYTIRERIRIKGEIRTLTAQQRLSGYVVGFLPIGLAGFLFVAAPGFMDPMFLNPPAVLGLPAGVVILIFGGFMMFIGFMFIRKIVDIEV
jgi:tight adherence protein B